MVNVKDGSEKGGGTSRAINIKLIASLFTGSEIR